MSERTVGRIMLTAMWALIATVAGFIAIFQNTPLLNRSLLASRVTLDPARMKPMQGHAYKYPGLWFGLGDQVDTPRSAVVLLEDELELAPARARHDHIGERGGGAWSHWTRWIIFSASDGSDPRANGRRYSVMGLTAPIRVGAVLLSILGAWMAVRSFMRVVRRRAVPMDAAMNGDGASEHRRGSSTGATAMTGRRRIALALATIAVSVGLILMLLGVLEVALRLTSPAPGDATLRLASPLGWERLQHPWRQAPRDAEVTPGTARVLMLGDSFSHGRTWVDKTINALRTAGIDAVGFEAGVSGYGTTQSLLLFDRLLPELRPDVVILQFYAWNDMRDNWRHPAICYNPRMVRRPYMDEHGAITTPSTFSVRVRGLEIWKQLFEPLFESMRVSYTQARIDEVGIDTIATRREPIIVDFHMEESWTPFYRPSRQEGAYVSGAWHITELALQALRDRCAEHGIPLILVAIDGPFTVDAVAMELGAPAELLRQGDWDENLPLRRLAAMASSLGIHLLDVTPGLRSRRDRMNGAPQYDGEGLGAHLLPDSEEVFAEALVPVLDPLLRDAQRRR